MLNFGVVINRSDGYRTTLSENLSLMSHYKDGNLSVGRSPARHSQISGCKRETDEVCPIDLSLVDADKTRRLDSYLIEQRLIAKDGPIDSEIC
jgi:hypothetical protein